MAKFEYQARNNNGKLIRGKIDASDRLAAKELITKQDMQLISLDQQKKSSINLNIQIGTPKVKLKDKVVFTRQLATMINAGVPLTRSLSTLAKQTDSKPLKAAMIDVTKQVESGSSFADSLAKYPEVFNDVFVNMVRAGEEGGILDDILNRLAIQQEKDAAIRGRLKSALTYPVVVIIITIIAFIIMMTVIVPKITGIIFELAGPDYELPLMTKVVTGISEGFQSYGIYIAAIIAAVVYLIRRYIKTKRGRHQFHALLLKIPVLGELIRKVAIARFARIFSSLNSAGVSVLDTLHVTADAVGNDVIKEKLNEAAVAVKNGKPMSAPLAADDLFPPILSQMIAIGEETGEVDSILLKLADFYEEEVNQSAESLTSIIEPIMIVILGGMVGVIVIAVIGPLGSVTQSLSG